MNDHIPSTKVVNGAVIRREAREIARKLIPAMPAPESHDPNADAKREAYALAKASRHKPWARRYLRQIGRSF